VIKTQSSIYGAYNKATATKNTIQLRSLDWDSSIPISNFPTIVVYHSNEEGSVPFANIGWPGFIGSLTGYSAVKIGLGERIGNNITDTQQGFGTPWNYITRDALQFSQTYNEAIKELSDAKRACSIYLGVI
jgi:exportin-7